MKIEDIRKDLKLIAEEERCMAIAFVKKHGETGNKEIPKEKLQLQTNSDNLHILGFGMSGRGECQGSLHLNDEGAIFIRDWLCELYGLPEEKSGS